jgi:hypothetical protein
MLRTIMLLMVRWRAVAATHTMLRTIMLLMVR